MTMRDAAADDSQVPWQLQSGSARDLVIALLDDGLDAEQRDRLAREISAAASFEQLPLSARQRYNRAHERRVDWFGFPPGSEGAELRACEKHCRALAAARAAPDAREAAASRSPQRFGGRSYGWGARIDWEQTVLDVDLFCPDCGSYSHHRGVYPDFLLRCPICGGWYCCDAGQYGGDEARVIIRGSELRYHERKEWMLEAAIRDREPEPGGDDYWGELCRRSEEAFGDGLRLFRPREMAREVPLERAQAESREEDDQPPYPVCEWPCRTCPTYATFPTWFKVWSAKRRAGVAEVAAAEAAEARVEAAQHALADLIDELSAIERRREGDVNSRQERTQVTEHDENSLALLLRAAAFSAEQHRPQRRKNVEESPYVNHPIEVAHVLASTGGITDVVTLVAALLHDTIEDTPASAGDLEREFGAQVRSLVEEVTDDKSLDKARRKELQILHAPSLTTRAKQIKLGDRICNVRDVLADPPAGWDLQRRLEYLSWSAAVAEGCRGANEALERCLDKLLVEGREALVEE